MCATPSVSSYEFDGSIIAHCELIEDPSDVYIQFITVEEVRANEATGEVRRRVAGLNKPRRAEGNWEDVNLFNCNIDFEHDWHLSPHWNLVTNVHAGFGMTASLAYKLTLSEFYIKANMKAFFELGLKVGVDGYVEGTYSAENIPVIGALAKRFTRVPFPANMPIMYAKVMPEPFIRGEAHLNVSLTSHGSRPLGAETQSWRAHFDNVKGVLYGHVYYERASATRIESYEFSISGMPVGTVGLLSNEVSLEAQAGATSWYGDGAATYWKTEDGSPCHVSSYCRTVRYMDDNDIWQEVIDTDPVEITVYLHIKGSSTIVPECE